VVEVTEPFDVEVVPDGSDVEVPEPSDVVVVPSAVPESSGLRSWNTATDKAISRSPMINPVSSGELGGWAGGVVGGSIGGSGSSPEMLVRSA
jgi:hypothetical protein